MRVLSYSPLSACPPHRPPRRARSCPSCARSPPRPPPRPLRRLHENGRLEARSGSHPPPERAPQCPRFGKRGPGIEPGHSPQPPWHAERPPGPPSRLQRGRPPRRSPAPRRRHAPVLAAFPSAAGPEMAASLACGHRQPSRRRRRRVTCQGRCASGGPAQRVDAVTATAFPAWPGRAPPPHPTQARHADPNHWRTTSPTATAAISSIRTPTPSFPARRTCTGSTPGRRSWSASTTITVRTARCTWRPGAGGPCPPPCPRARGSRHTRRGAADRGAGPRISGENGAGGNCRARRRVSGPGRRAVEFCWAIRPATQAVRIPQRIAVQPLDAYSLAVACGSRGVSQGTPVPPAIRRAGLRALPRQGARHRIAPPSRARPRATACCLAARSTDRQARAVYRTPQRNGRQGNAPVSRATATWRSVPLRRVDRSAARLRRGTSGTFRCPHRRQTFRPATPQVGQVTAAHCTTPSLRRHYPRA